MIPFAMEGAHPVPQNVTSFEFHLIGDMTIKQFGYLSAGGIIAYVAYVAIYPLNPILAVPIIAISGLLGPALAFLPIYDRPLDHWIWSFFKSVYSPTQRYWKLSGQQALAPIPETVFKNRLQIYLDNLDQPEIMPDTPTPIAISRLGQAASLPADQVMNTSEMKPAAHPTTPPASLNPSTQPPPSGPAPQAPPPAGGPAGTPKPSTQQHLPTSEELTKLVSLAKQSQVLQSKITETEKRMEQIKQQSIRQPDSWRADQPISQEEVGKIFDNLQALIKQANNLSAQISQIDKTPPRSLKPPVVVVPKLRKELVTKNISLTTSPNVVSGTIKDASGNLLDGVIVIIHNKEGIPVRALKTNKLGQFTGASPLPQGTYTITVEKDNLEFDTLQITLADEVIGPINISAKAGGLNV